LHACLQQTMVNQLAHTKAITVEAYCYEAVTA